MEEIVKKLPEEVRIGRLFIVDDGQGIILESGIQEAAKVFGKTVNDAPGFSKNLAFLSFRAGDMAIYQIVRKGA